ncbi:MAG: hypothetical protein AAFN93_04640 [Bacteroidota bacterium]
MKKVKIAFASILVAGLCYMSFGTNTDPIRPKKADCYCLDVYRPVCIIATGQRFGNACYASCAGYSPNEWVDCSTQVD